MVKPPNPMQGLRHLALKVTDLEACERFYVDLIGMRVLFRAHEHLVYLTSGNDNLSLSRKRGVDHLKECVGPMDHFGFIVKSKKDLESWFVYLRESGVPILASPHDHKDGARSFYCLDPDGNKVQPIYHPVISSDCED